jgi:hypothetical protein
VTWTIVAMAIELVVLLNWPGHLSVDSIIQLYEGASGRYQSFNPPFASWLLARFYTEATGPGLIAALLTVGLYASLLPWLLKLARAQSGWWIAGLVVLGAWTLTPLGLVYPAIVWKDVLLAVLALGLYSALASAEQLRQDMSGRRLRLGLLGLAALLAAATLMSRQHGIVFVLGAVIALAVRPEGRKAAAEISVRAEPYRSQSTHGRQVGNAAVAGPKPPWVFAAVWAVLVLACVFAANILVHALAVEGPPRGNRIGWMLLMVYDIGGIASRQSAVDLAYFQALGVDTAGLVRDMRASFDPARIDGFNPEKLWQVRPSAETVAAQWWQLVEAYPGDYVAHRSEVFAWMLGLRDPAACLPIHLGIAADPAPLLAELKLSPIPPEKFAALYRHASQLFATPVFRPIAWLGIVIAAALILAWRGARRNRLPLALAASTVSYCLSYAVIGLACDLRYMYVAAPVALWLLLAVLDDLSRQRPKR